MGWGGGQRGDACMHPYLYWRGGRVPRRGSRAHERFFFTRCDHSPRRGAPSPLCPVPVPPPLPRAAPRHRVRDTSAGRQRAEGAALPVCREGTPRHRPFPGPATASWAPAPSRQSGPALECHPADGRTDTWKGDTPPAP